jgi:hypothetical protein
MIKRFIHYSIGDKTAACQKYPPARLDPEWSQRFFYTSPGYFSHFPESFRSAKQRS